MSGRWLHLCILAAVVASIQLALPTSALAQEEENQLQEEGNLPSYGVVVVDLDRVLVKSQAGRNLQEQVKTLTIQLQEDAKRSQDELRAEKEDIAAMSPTQDGVDEVDIEAAMRNFESKDKSTWKNFKIREEAINVAVQNARRILFEHSQQALLKVAKERGVILAFDPKVVLLSAVPDLTKAVIEALDARVQEVPLDVADTNE